MKFNIVLIFLPALLALLPGFLHGQTAADMKVLAYRGDGAL
jgi:hypothetical protein